VSVWAGIFLLKRVMAISLTSKCFKCLVMFVWLSCVLSLCSTHRMQRGDVDLLGSCKQGMKRASQGEIHSGKGSASLPAR